MNQEFSRDLDNQMQELMEENSVLERIIEIMQDKKQDKMQQYVFSITKQKLKHNIETIALYSSIISDIHGNKGMLS